MPVLLSLIDHREGSVSSFEAGFERDRSFSCLARFGHAGRRKASQREPDMQPRRLRVPGDSAMKQFYGGIVGVVLFEYLSEIEIIILVVRIQPQCLLKCVNSADWLSQLGICRPDQVLVGGRSTHLARKRSQH